ncbi:MAG: hypothetical protein RBR40_13880, partial [Tenuifilaceae bacterium]|nr:hypothetical protein [Tenuifilaceae bacterium]
SSSAAVRFGLLSQNEVITTPLSIFEDVKSITTQTPNSNIQDIANTITTQTPSSNIQDIANTITTQTPSSNIQDIANTIEKSLQTKFDNTKQKQWIKDNNWNTISKTFYNALM